LLISLQAIPARPSFEYLKMGRRGFLILRFFESCSFGHETREALRLKNQALTINFNTYF